MELLFISSIKLASDTYLPTDPIKDVDRKFNYFSTLVERFLTILFTIEATLKIISYGFIFDK